VPDEQDSTQDFSEAATGSGNPGPLVLPLRLLRSFNSADVRPDVADFLRANVAESGDRSVQVTESVIQFV
jgi:hypothetical protein